MERNLLYSLVICFPNSNTNLIQKHPHGHTQSDVCPGVWIPRSWVRRTQIISVTFAIHPPLLNAAQGPLIQRWNHWNFTIRIL